MCLNLHLYNYIYGCELEAKLDFIRVYLYDILWPLFFPTWLDLFYPQGFPFLLK